MRGGTYKPRMPPALQQLFDLSGRVAIVTGGSRGLGREMADGLAEAGAKLMLCARRQEWLTPTLDELRKQGIAVEGELADVAKPKDVQKVVDATLKAFGKLDILVNNAGVTSFVEVGAGKVLSGLVKRIVRDAQAQSVGGPADIEAFLKAV